MTILNEMMINHRVQSIPSNTGIDVAPVRTRTMAAVPDEVDEAGQWHPGEIADCAQGPAQCQRTEINDASSGTALDVRHNLDSRR